MKTPQGFPARHPFPSTYVFAQLLHSSLWFLPLCTGKCAKVSCLSKLSSSWTFGCRQKTFHGLFLSTSVGISRFLASPGLTWVTWSKRKLRELTALSFLKPQVPKLVWLLPSKFLCFSFTCGPGFLTFLNRLSRKKKKYTYYSLSEVERKHDASFFPWRVNLWPAWLVHLLGSRPVKMVLKLFNFCSAT